ncbi:hypothetical protein GCM10027347_55770 [Larkinella harenae]
MQSIITPSDRQAQNGARLSAKSIRVIKVAVALLLMNSVVCNGQKLMNYFKYQAVKSLAEFAHPTNDFKSGSYQVFSNYFGANDDMIIVDIYYQGNIYTQLALRKQYGMFTKIAVVKDTDFIAPFSAVAFLKDLMLEAMKSVDNTSKSEVEIQLEKALQRQLQFSNGLDIALYSLNLNWLMY